MNAYFLYFNHFIRRQRKNIGILTNIVKLSQTKCKEKVLVILLFHRS